MDEKLQMMMDEYAAKTMMVQFIKPNDRGNKICQTAIHFEGDLAYIWCVQYQGRFKKKNLSLMQIQSEFVISDSTGKTGMDDRSCFDEDKRTQIVHNKM